MKKGMMIGIIIGVVVVLILGFFILSAFKKSPPNQIQPQENINSHSSQTNNNPDQIVDCKDDMSCFQKRMMQCSPVKGTLTAQDGTSIDLIILGVENETCHFERDLNSVKSMECYFKKGTLNWDTIDQTLGNDHGLQSVVDSACKAASASW